MKTSISITILSANYPPVFAIIDMGTLIIRTPDNLSTNLQYTKLLDGSIRMKFGDWLTIIKLINDKKRSDAKAYANRTAGFINGYDSRGYR
jgi:hypothetical protein